MIHHLDSDDLWSSLSDRSSARPSTRLEQPASHPAPFQHCRLLLGWDSPCFAGRIAKAQQMGRQA